MAYLYRHIRLDKNEPFYIGIGSDNNFKRANWKFRNNKIWNSIINKTNYEVEILLDGLSWEEACIKEKEFINLYGRKDKNTGILANLTDGGEGTYGHILSNESKKLISDKLKGRKLSEETCLKMSNNMIGRIPSNKGIKMSEEQKNKIALANKKPKQKIKCEVCGQMGGISAMKRWHFNNCKNKNL